LQQQLGRSLQKPARQKPRIEHDFFCVNCIFDLNADIGKYEPVYRQGKIRVKLEPIAETLFICPRCGAMHVTNEFKNEEADAKIREKKRRKRIEALRQIHR
jgi:hypothetical protein